MIGMADLETVVQRERIYQGMRLAGVPEGNLRLGQKAARFKPSKLLSGLCLKAYARS